MSDRTKARMLSTTQVGQEDPDGIPAVPFRIGFQLDRLELEALVMQMLLNGAAFRYDGGDPQWPLLPDWSQEDVRARVTLALRGDGMRAVQQAREALNAWRRADPATLPPDWAAVTALAFGRAARLVGAAWDWSQVPPLERVDLDAPGAADAPGGGGRG